jgi:hypothetical protein
LIVINHTSEENQKHYFWEDLWTSVRTWKMGKRETHKIVQGLEIHTPFQSW